MPTNTLTFPIGGAEAILDGIGEELNELAGFRETRLSASVAVGDASIPVESTFEWPTPGLFFMAGQLYAYAGKTASTFTGITPVIAEAQPALTPLVDWSRTYSALDLARRALLVDYAESEYLDALGRNYGVYRFPGLTDDTFRSAIKSLAFAPKGTITTITTVLNYLVGVGNFDVFEDLVNFPNQVFITLDATFQANTTAGKTYFNARETRTSLTSTTVAPLHAPLGLGVDSVVGVYLAPELQHAYFDVKPSLEPLTPWTYTGTLSEASSVLDDTGGAFDLTDTSSSVVGAQYQRPLNASVTSDVFVVASVKRASSTSNALQIRVSDGTRMIAVAWSATQISFFDATANAFIGVASSFNSTAAHSVELRKYGGANGPTGNVELWIDGLKVDSLPYTSFPTSASRLAQFGSFSTTGQMASTWSSFEVFSRDPYSNFWNQFKTADGSVSSSFPARLNSASSAFSTTFSTNRPLAIRSGTAAHGRNNGHYKVASVDGSGAFVDVVGITHDRLVVVDGDTVRIPAGDFDAFVPEDAGVQATRTTGAGLSGLVWSARYGGADGNAITVRLVDPGSALSPLQVNVLSGAITVSLATDAGSALVSTAAQVQAAVQANVTSAALVDTSLVLAPGSGVMAAATVANLTGGEDGKFLTITGAGAAGNNGTRKIATLLDDRTVRLGSHLAIPALDNTDVVLPNWRKDPNFSTESGVEWEISGAGTVAAGPLLTMQRALYAANVAVEVVYLTTRTGEILANEFDRNAGARFPFYLADPYAFVRAIIDAITVAGVIPQYR